jgi:hypothetical protein
MSNEQDEPSVFSALYATTVYGFDLADFGFDKGPEPKGGGPGGGSGGIKGLNSGKASNPKGPTRGFKPYTPASRFSKINPVAKLSFVKSNKDSARHIIQHCNYLQLRERADHEPPRQWHSRDRDNIPREEVIKELLDNRGSEVAMFKIILSPNNNELHHEEMARKVMDEWQEKIDLKIDYFFVKHENTRHHHMHFVLQGKTTDGKDYRIERGDIQLLRETAFQYQYEVEYEFIKDQYHMELEMQAWREQQERDPSYFQNLELMKELGIYRPEWEKQIQQDLGLAKVYYFEPVWLPPDKENPIWLAPDLNRIAEQEYEKFQKEHPELFPGLTKGNEDKEVQQGQNELTNFLTKAAENPDLILEQQKPEPQKEDPDQERYQTTIDQNVQQLYDLVNKEQEKDLPLDNISDALTDLVHGKEPEIEQENQDLTELEKEDLEPDKKDDDPVLFLMMAAKIDPEANPQPDEKEVPPEIFIWETATHETDDQVYEETSDIDLWQDDYIGEIEQDQMTEISDTQAPETDLGITEEDLERDDDDDW